MNIARDIIGIIIIVGAVLSFFLNVSEVGAELLRFFSGAVIGFYFTKKDFPLSSFFQKKVSFNNTEIK